MQTPVLCMLFITIYIFDVGASSWSFAPTFRELVLLETWAALREQGSVQPVLTREKPSFPQKSNEQKWLRGVASLITVSVLNVGPTPGLAKTTN